MQQCLLPETLAFSIPIEVVSIEETVQRIHEAVFANIEFGAALPGSAE